ncbi:CHAT domain-containing protein [Streptomyces sp. DSM 110735]|uniref:CHAT domain-containing protein n=1 Tax=Streptomyces sp. DSM 110735 TaxID=2775031 RepID=UPI0018F3B983|nr:CHAT domain-containing protein [Streptomyces sp. DSM 110735]MBJ7906529.1 CHAT domain-containing protein [Streptomyces sp. DSM 110735]
MSLFGRSPSPADRHRAAAQAYKSIQDRYNAAMQARMSLESVRDDVWDLQLKLFDDVVKGHTAVAGPLFSAARLSFFIEFGTGVDWTRATMSALAFSTACCVLDTVSSARDEPMPAPLLREMRGMALGSAYVAHRCGVPLAGVMTAEAITSLTLGDRMINRETAATLTAEGGMSTLRHQLAEMRRTAAAELRSARRSSVRPRSTGASLQEATRERFLADLATYDTTDGTTRLATSPNAVASARAALASGRTLIYVAPAPRSATAIRLNYPPRDREICESIELPALDLPTVRTLVDRVRTAYAAAARGELGRKALSRLIHEVLDQVTAAFWTPLLAAWPELRTIPIALIPLGEAALLPFYTALVDDTPACTTLDLTLAPSARALLLSAGWQPAPNGKTLVAADPWYDGEGFQSIPRTVPEARAIATVHGVEPKLFRAAGEPEDREGTDTLRTTNGKAPAGQDAPAAEIAAHLSEATLIHLACHGELRSDAPLSSALLLGSPLPLNAILKDNLRPGATVVLSACELASITGDLPDEQLGFPAALLAVGARSVIGALWPVPDTPATVDLMTDTHRGLVGSSATGALGRAIGRAHADGVATSVWASFACFGA